MFHVKHCLGVASPQRLLVEICWPPLTYHPKKRVNILLFQGICSYKSYQEVWLSPQCWSIREGTHSPPPLVTQLNTTSTIFPLYSTLFLCFSETLLKKNMGGRSWLMLRKCRRRNSYFAFLNVHKFSYCYLVFFFAIISN